MPAQLTFQPHACMQESVLAPPNYQLIGTADAAVTATII
jgi:hypothetical protein